MKYHLGTEGKFVSEDGAMTKVYLAANPSHLEAVNPVLEGIVRAKQDRLDLAGEAFTVLPVLLHGDAAFAGQGVVAETLNLSQLRGYRTGGTIHVVINNQVGFTTSPSSSRSSFYSTDVARMIQAPIFHVNGDDPEACVRVAELAYEFRQEFNKDVVIDMVCYRRRGHNEGDDPSMTQPLMYNLIEAKRSVRKLYTEALIGRGDISGRGGRGSAARLPAAARAGLRRDQGGHPAPAAPPTPARTRCPAATPRATAASSGPPRRRPTSRRRPVVPTRPSRPRTLQHIGDAFVNMPEGFTVHPKLQQLVERRAAMVREGGIDWAMGELLAFGSLLMEGVPVRLAGQDRRRGTFVQRHAVLIDKATAEEWTPLLYLGEGQAPVLGLRLAAQRVRRHGLRVRLLRRAAGRPRAVGGAVRRLRQRRADDHRRVHLLLRAEVGPALLGRAAAAPRLRGPGTGPLLRPHRALPADVRRGQHDGGLPVDARRRYFHLLRRQAYARPRRPLIVFTPKSMLRLKAAACRRRGLHPRRVPPGAARPRAAGRRRRHPGAARLAARSSTTSRPSAASARTPAPRSCGSSSSPRCRPPRSPLRCAEYPGAEVVWVQDEPANQGAWPFMALNLPQALADHAEGRSLRVVARPASASPATGSSKKHAAQQAALVAQAFDR